MDYSPQASGAFSVWDAGNASPSILRLLPWVHHPPAKVLVPGLGSGQEVAALHARGYAVVALERAPSAADLPVERGDFVHSDYQGSFDLICERGYFAGLAPSERAAYVQAAARALRPGGILFGVFLEGRTPTDRAPFGTTAAELLRAFAPAFDVQLLGPAPFGGPGERAQLEAILVRRVD